MLAWHSPGISKMRPAVSPCNPPRLSFHRSCPAALGTVAQHLSHCDLSSLLMEEVRPPDGQACLFTISCVCVCMLSHFSHVQHFLTLWIIATRLLCPWDSPGKNTSVGCHTLLQGILPTLGSNLHFLCLLYSQVGSLPLVPPEKPQLNLISQFKNHLANPTVSAKKDDHLA